MCLSCLFPVNQRGFLQTYAAQNDRSARIVSWMLWFFLSPFWTSSSRPRRISGVLCSSTSTSDPYRSIFLKYQLLVGLLYRITSWKLTSLEPVSWARLGNYPSRDANHRTGRDRFIQVKVLRRCCKNFQQECQTEINKYIIK